MFGNYVSQSLSKIFPTGKNHRKLLLQHKFQTSPMWVFFIKIFFFETNVKLWRLATVKVSFIAFTSLNFEFFSLLGLLSHIIFRFLLQTSKW